MPSPIKGHLMALDAFVLAIKASTAPKSFPVAHIGLHELRGQWGQWSCRTMPSPPSECIAASIRVVFGTQQACPVHKHHWFLLSMLHLKSGLEEEAKADHDRGVRRGISSLMRASRRPRRIVVDEGLGGGQDVEMPDHAFVVFWCGKGRGGGQPRQGSPPTGMKGGQSGLSLTRPDEGSDRCWQVHGKLLPEWLVDKTWEEKFAAYRGEPKGVPRQMIKKRREGYHGLATELRLGAR